MGFHTFPSEQADSLEDPARFRFCSREELVSLIDPSPAAVVADFGSGTGFFTDEVAPFVGHCYALDVQTAMHDRYREKGVPDNVELVAAGVEDAPLEDDELDAAFSTMTYHEYATEDALAEIRRVLRPGGLHAVVDWSSEGSDAHGPPADETFALADAVGHHREAGFQVETASARPDTFLLSARAPEEA